MPWRTDPKGVSNSPRHERWKHHRKCQGTFYWLGRSHPPRILAPAPALPSRTPGTTRLINPCWHRCNRDRRQRRAGRATAKTAGGMRSVRPSPLLARGASLPILHGCLEITGRALMARTTMTGTIADGARKNQPMGVALMAAPLPPPGGAPLGPPRSTSGRATARAQRLPASQFGAGDLLGLTCAVGSPAFISPAPSAGGCADDLRSPYLYPAPGNLGRI